MFRTNTFGYPAAAAPLLVLDALGVSMLRLDCRLTRQLAIAIAFGGICGQASRAQQPPTLKHPLKLRYVHYRDAPHLTQEPRDEGSAQSPHATPCGRPT